MYSKFIESDPTGQLISLTQYIFLSQSDTASSLKVEFTRMFFRVTMHPTKNSPTTTPKPHQPNLLVAAIASVFHTITITTTNCQATTFSSSSSERVSGRHRYRRSLLARPINEFTDFTDWEFKQPQPHALTGWEVLPSSFESMSLFLACLWSLVSMLENLICASYCEVGVSSVGIYIYIYTRENGR